MGPDEGMELLAAALEDWRNELHQRALTAAFSGKRAQVLELVRKARIDGEDPPWSKKVLGQLALYEGRSLQAITAAIAGSIG